MSCNHNCSSCDKDCNERKEIPLFKTRPETKIKHIVAIMSGKGGVGKSLITSLLAAKFNKLGYKVGILDADITGPSIPHSFGIKEKAKGNTGLIYPCVSKNGVKIVSVNLMLENQTDPVVWRGPILAGAVKQFYEETYWEELDYLFVDMPPGTSDVALTVYQNLPIDGVVLVSTPQDLVSMIVGKAVGMANKANVKIIGLVENMAYIKCPCCNEKIYPYGESKLTDICSTYHLIPLGSLPIEPEVAKLVDGGNVEDLDISDLDIAVSEIEAL
ncbi:MAG: Mrp/NBP35 family ATP-binding protein [Anaeroplasmataceae bacterium]